MALDHLAAHQHWRRASGIQNSHQEACEQCLTVPPRLYGHAFKIVPVLTTRLIMRRFGIG
jgi:hypothetical protein